MDVFDETQFVRYTEPPNWNTASHEFKSNTNIITFTLWMGKDRDYYSIPIEKHLSINTYEQFVVCVKSQKIGSPYTNFVNPREISETLYEFSVEFYQSYNIVTKESTLSYYEALCVLFNDGFNYCKECGIRLMQKQDLCWACEKGI